MRPYVVVVALAGSLWAQPVADPDDSVLVARFLTPQQEMQFSRSDNALSAFWSDWLGCDSILLAPPEDCMAQPCSLDGPADASLVVKAAAGAGGLYLTVGVTDDIWVAQRHGDDWYWDMVLVYMDTLSAAQLREPCPPGWECWTRLTATTHEVLAWPGAAAPPDSCYFGRYDAALWSWVRSRESLQDMQARSGYGLEMVRVSPAQRALELRVPWSSYCGGLGSGGTLNARRLGFWVGYGDCDNSDSSAPPDYLHWLGTSPWEYDVGWGEILLPDGLGVVTTPVVPDPGNTGAVRWARASPGGPPALFSLAGRVLKTAPVTGPDGVPRVFVVRGSGGAVHRRVTPAR